MHRFILIAAQLAATVLFILNFERATQGHWLAWVIPMVLIFLVVINSLRITRFVSWLIFSFGFFGFLVVLSSFTLRWRLEPGFDAMPFYQAIFMYVAFVYVSLGHLAKLKYGV